jgi:hypothetical protein
MESLQELFVQSFQYQTSKLYTAIPCIVLAVKNSLNESMVDVQPSVSTVYRGNSGMVAEDHPPILSVPVVFPASKTSAFTFPINVGDTVLCIFSQRGIDNFKQGDGSPTMPTDYRKFDKRDAIAIPGLFPFSKSINNSSKRTFSHDTSDAVIAHNIGTGNEVEIRLKASGDMIINTNNKNVTINTQSATINSTSATFNIQNSVWNGNLTFNGNLVQNGVYTLDGVNMNAHRHTGVQTGSGTTGTPL